MFIENDLLFRSTLSERQLVVPRALHLKLLTEAHGGVTAGHFGQARTMARLRAKYYRLGMSVDVQVFCQQCSSCAHPKILLER